MTAREIIAMCQHDHGLTFPSEFEVADHVIDRLTSAGFHILGPDEIAAVVEACEEAMPYVSRYESDNFSNAALDTVTKLDTAIGALKEKRT